MRLPLSEDDAQTLVRESHQAPFGKGTETVIDESVRKTWEIDAGKVQFLNTRWQHCLDQIVKNVAEELGVAGNVCAEFYKMLLYEKGAMFKPHKEYVICRLQGYRLMVLQAPRRPQACLAHSSSVFPLNTRVEPSLCNTEQNK